MFAQKLKTYFDCLTTDRICALLILRYENRLVSFPDSGVEYAELFFLVYYFRRQKKLSDRPQ